MAKALTPTAVERAKARDKRQEIPDGQVPGLFLIVQATTGTKSFAMRFTREGRKSKLVLGPWDDSGVEGEETPSIGMPLTLTGARALAASIHRDRARGIDVIGQRRQQRAGTGHTFALAAQEFIAEYRADRRGWRETAKMLGLQYDGDGEPKIVADGLCGRWREKSVRDVTSDDIYVVISEARRKNIPGMAKIGTGSSDSRARHLSNALRAVFKWLKDHRRIDADPTAGVHRPKAPPRRQRVLNTKATVRDADELRSLWTACNKMGPPFGSLVRVLLLTGQRRDEISLLEWREIDDGITTISLPGSRMKNKLPHQVPVSAPVRAILQSMPRTGKYVFTSVRKHKKPFAKSQGAPPISGFSKFKIRLDALMPGVEAWQLHDLRRSAASGMAAIGIAPHIIEAVLHHVSGFRAGVAGTYNVEAYEPEKRAALEAWASYVIGVVES